MTGRGPAVVRRVLPFGGAVEVARSYLRIHVRDWWTGRCRACGDVYPCRDRRDARLVAGGTDPLVGPAGNRIAWLALPALVGLVLTVVAALGWSREPTHQSRVRAWFVDFSLL
ncbi:MAG TPA: hypothetical protein VFZ32_02495 [Micromonosporaceae bacterium]